MQWVRRLASATVGASLFLLGIAGAADPVNHDEEQGAEATEVDVVVHSERPSERFPSTQSSYRVNEDDVQDEAATSLADLFRRGAPVSVQQTTPGQPTIYLRGLSGRAVVHVVDGVRLNSTIFRAGNNPYLGLVDPHSLHNAEVVLGPASTRFGSDALGGALLLRTRLPDYRLKEPFGMRTFQSLSSNPLGVVSHIGWW